jgi:hypothetical protein
MTRRDAIIRMDCLRLSPARVDDRLARAISIRNGEGAMGQPIGFSR